MSKNIKKLKKARSILDVAIVGYTEGNVAAELDEAYKIIDEVITGEESDNGHRETWIHTTDFGRSERR